MGKATKKVASKSQDDDQTTRLELIRAVRSLDQGGPGENGENLQHLWDRLAASSDSRYHAVEESCLRWLLRSMPVAETLRRFPLTWTILNCVFQRIPLFSLAKSLADRKFFSVLQQIVNDVSSPTNDSSKQTSSKRKRSAAIGYSLDELKTFAGCLQTSQALFVALDSLLQRIDEAEERSSHDVLGAEHIRSLFSTSASDMAGIVSPLLRICDSLLSTSFEVDAKSQRKWINTASALWDLRLQSSQDTIDVAVQLFNPAASILSKLNGHDESFDGDIEPPLQNRWRQDLETFITRNLILPAQTAFLGRRDTEAIGQTLAVSGARLHLSAYELYLMASSPSNLVTGGGSRRASTEWMATVFKIIEEAIRKSKNRNIVIQKILSVANERKVPVGLSELRLVLQTYALSDDSTDWALVAKVSSCDPGVFQGSDEAEQLLSETCRRYVANVPSVSDYPALVDTIKSIMQSFQMIREPVQFLKLWYAQLCQLNENISTLESPWMEIALHSDTEASLRALIVGNLSVSQLDQIINWVQSQDVHPLALALFSSGMAEGIRGEALTNAAGARLYDLVVLDKGQSPLIAPLKWRIAARTMHWVAHDRKCQVWSSAKDSLSKALKSGDLQSRQTFEAFICCCEAWVAMEPIDEERQDIPGILIPFMERLASETFTKRSKPTASPSSPGSNSHTEGLGDVTRSTYLAWYTEGSSRFGMLLSSFTRKMPAFLVRQLSDPKLDVATLQAVWEAVLDNDINLNDPKVTKELVDRLIESLEPDNGEPDWPSAKDEVHMRLLSRLPLDVFSRSQRERTMSILIKKQASLFKSKHVRPGSWNLFLTLSIQMMTRPTFYNKMKFSDLVEMADGLSELAHRQNLDGIELLELLELYGSVTTLTIRQMTEHLEERSMKYLLESDEYLSKWNTSKRGKSYQLLPLSIVLLTKLHKELQMLAASSMVDNLRIVSETTEAVLSKHITATLEYYMGDRVDHVDETFLMNKFYDDFKILAIIDAVAETESPKLLSGSKLHGLAGTAQETWGDMWETGDLKAWKLGSLIRRGFGGQSDQPLPTAFESLDMVNRKMKCLVMQDYVESCIHNLSDTARLSYLRDLIDKLCRGDETDGQLLAIHGVVEKLIETNDSKSANSDGFDLGTAHGQLTSRLQTLKTAESFAYVCRTLHVILEKQPQALGQWNIELVLGTVCDLCSPAQTLQSPVSFTWLCKLVQVVIKKHRLRLEGHYHLLLAALQALLGSLVLSQSSNERGAITPQEAKAKHFARLITLVCEPTAGAVSRTQQRSSLDSATDTAKRSAGRQMYLVLMQYVKLQLETDIPVTVREALEPAMSSIFGITTPETRKILNDAMDGSGRAILREMFKSYTRFGKWSGV